MVHSSVVLVAAVVVVVAAARAVVVVVVAGVAKKSTSTLVNLQYSSSAAGREHETRARAFGLFAYLPCVLELREH